MTSLDAGREGYLTCEMQNCPKLASYAYDVPMLGDTLYFCTSHCRSDRFHKEWYIVTPEMVQDELKRRESLRMTVEKMRIAKNNR